MSLWPHLPPLPAGEVVVLAPEPVPWLSPLLDALGERATVLAPWARPAAPRSARPAAIAAPLARRVLPGVRGVPGGDLLDAGLARLGADRPSLQYPVAHHRRIVFGRIAARWLRRRRPAAVIAPSFAATALFAAARDSGAQTVLIHDWPDLLALHTDLDAAVRHHPDDPWLRRFRPPARWIAEQRSERHLADRILVRGAFVARRIAADGIAAHRVVCPAPPTPAARLPARRTHVLLAGRGAARGGAYAALALLERMPELRLVGEAGSAALPALLAHPRFESVPADGVPWPNIAAVLAPAWAEAYPSAVIAGAARAVPVIATTRAAGPLDICSPVEPGDITAMVDALRAVGGRAAQAR